jgi:putative transposase
MIPENRLRAKDLYQISMKTFTEHLKLDIQGYRCDNEMLFSVLTKAALENGSLQSACDDLDGVADGNTLREQLNEALDVADLQYQEVEMNAALVAGLPAKLPKGGVEVAIDFHDDPFYGKSGEMQTYSCRDRAKKGTTRFLRIASASVMWRGIRLTLALTYVLPEYSTLDVLKRLLQRLKGLGFQATVLYLDKGFCCGAVIRYLQDQRQKTVLACPIRGTTGGTRALCHGRKSYRTAYRFTDGTVADMVVVATLPPGKHGRRRRKWLLFVIIGLDWSAKKVMKRYRRRFGIESTYRQRRQLRIISTSRNPAVRFFLLGFSLVLVNLWARLRWQWFQRPGRGPRTVIAAAFKLKRFVGLLRRAIDQLYDAISSVPTTAPCQIVIY